MELCWLPANQAYCFTFGDSIIPMGDAPRFMNTKAEAMAAAHAVGLYVDGWGNVSTDAKVEA